MKKPKQKNCFGAKKKFQYKRKYKGNLDGMVFSMSLFENFE